MPTPLPDCETVPSILDRLVSACAAADGDHQAHYDHHQLAESVLSDLQDLLGTMATARVSERDYPEVSHSLLSYGFPDLAIHDGATLESRNGIAAALRHAIDQFEPRLQVVRVTPMDHPAAHRQLSLLVEARLMSGSSRAFSFVTDFDLARRKVNIRPVSQ